MDELLIQVDEQDNVVGPVDRLKAHLDDGILHRGLMVVVKNNDHQILLTQRSMERPDLGFPPPFPGFWDITLAGHPKWGESDYVSQMVTELQEELGIQVKANHITVLDKFLYHAPDPTYPNPQTAQTFRLSEREICAVGVVHALERPILNSMELQDSMWVEDTKLAHTLRSLKIAPWALLMSEKMLTKLMD